MKQVPGCIIFSNADGDSAGLGMHRVSALNFADVIHPSSTGGSL